LRIGGRNGKNLSEPPSPRTITVLNVLKVAGGHDEDASEVKSDEGEDKLDEEV
jgi:hypothetical protein